MMTTEHGSALYRETYRPQFHFTARRNWLNDPNGLLFYKGEYHLFFQHNPEGVDWGNMTWGHAVCPDLVHWRQLENAIEPDELGTIYSGSGVVDWANTTGFQSGEEAPLVVIYTSAGQPFTQSIAFSDDRGRTWTKYRDNPVLGHLVGSNRDPKVIWHAETGRWIMALYLDGNDYALFGSQDLKAWEPLSEIRLPGASECPDLFPLAVDGEPDRTKWVFWGANGRHIIGSFDGRAFLPETDVCEADHGANFYAAQTWSDVPAADGRRIQIAWMRGGRYPDMPFNQQMSFPCTLTLRATPDGVRLHREPVAELDHIRGETQQWADEPLGANDHLVADIEGDLFDIRADVEPGDADVIGFDVRGEKIEYDVRSGQLSCLGKSARLDVQEERIRLRILVDRTSIELFGNDGRLSMTSCCLLNPDSRRVAVYAAGGEARLRSLQVARLRSIWNGLDGSADD